MHNEHTSTRKSFSEIMIKPINIHNNNNNHLIIYNNQRNHAFLIWMECVCNQKLTFGMSFCVCKSDIYIYMKGWNMK